MKVTCVPVDAIQKTAKTILDFYENNQGLVAEMMKELNRCEASGCWKGSDLTKMKFITKNNQRIYEHNMESLEQMAEAMKQFASMMAEADEELRSRIAWL